MISRDLKAALRAILPLLALGACAAVEAPSARDAEAEAASRGLVYARAACAQCHAVAVSEPRSPNPDAPPFVVIANLPGMTPTALNAWLHSAHPTMPNLIVAPADRADLAAYLASIRRGERVT